MATGNAAGRLVALYGTLRQGQRMLAQLGLTDRLRPLGPCEIRGRLVDCGGYPGLIEGDGRVAADLFEVIDGSAWSVMDAYEEVGGPEAEYVRLPVRLLSPAGIVAQTYVYNWPIDGLAPIDSGDWLSLRHSPSR